jgi:hypothetical protein
MLRCALVPVVMAVAALDHDHAVPAMVTMPAAIVMVHAIFGTGAMRAMMMMTALDHHGLSARHSRCRDHERTQSRNHKTKLLHAVLLQSNAHLNRACMRTFRGNGK